MPVGRDLSRLQLFKRITAESSRLLGGQGLDPGVTDFANRWA